MSDSLIPPGHSGGNKSTVVILVAGALLLSAAAGVYFFKNGEKKQIEKPPPPQVAATPEAESLLVAETKNQPLLAAQPDASIDAGTQGDKAANKKSSGKKRPEKTGTIDAKKVAAFMNSHFGRVKACYESRLKNNSLLEGKLDLNIGISQSGRVTSIKVNSDTVRDPKMLGCVKTVIRSWRFPKPEGGRVVIGKTFNFKKS